MGSGRGSIAGSVSCLEFSYIKNNANKCIFVHLIDKNVRLYLSSVCASLLEQIYGPFHRSNNGLNQSILF